MIFLVIKYIILEIRGNQYGASKKAFATLDHAPLFTCITSVDSHNFVNAPLLNADFKSLDLNKIKRVARYLLTEKSKYFETYLALPNFPQKISAYGIFLWLNKSKQISKLLQKFNDSNFDIFKFCPLCKKWKMINISWFVVEQLIQRYSIGIRHYLFIDNLSNLFEQTSLPLVTRKMLLIRKRKNWSFLTIIIFSNNCFILYKNGRFKEFYKKQINRLNIKSNWKYLSISNYYQRLCPNH